MLHADRGRSHLCSHLQYAVQDKEQLYGAVVLLLHAACHQCRQLGLCLQPCTPPKGSYIMKLTAHCSHSMHL